MLSRRLKYRSTLLVLSLNIGVAFAAPMKDCRKDVTAERLYKGILYSAVEDQKTGMNFEDQELFLRGFLQDFSATSNTRLIDLSEFYLGESVGEVLSEIITSRGVKISSDFRNRMKSSSCVKNKIIFCGELDNSLKKKCELNLNCHEGTQRTMNLWELLSKNKKFKVDEFDLKPLSEDEYCIVSDKLKTFKK